MSEEMLVRYCSPTLAGMKTGNMFIVPPGFYEIYRTKAPANCSRNADIDLGKGLNVVLYG